MDTKKLIMPSILKKTALIFLCLFTLHISQAQNIKSDTVPATKAEKKQEKKFYNFGQFAHESWLFVKSPVTWDKYSWIRFGLAVGVTAALMPLDNAISKATVGTKYYYSVPIVGGRVYGEWYSIGIVTVGFGTYGLIARDTNAKKISIELLQAGLYSEAVTYLLKCVIGRARPYTGLGAFTFKPFSFADYAFNSMPSGHMTSAMALSTVMSRNAKKTFWKIMAYLPAAFTMASRLYQGQHFFSDEIFGSCIGYFVGNWVVNLHKERKHHIKVPIDLGTPIPK